MGGATALFMVQRMVQLSAVALEIATELSTISALINKAHAENRDINADDWAAIDKDLKEAKAESEKARAIP